MLTAETITDGEIRDLHAEVLDSDNPGEVFRGYELAPTCLEALGGRHLRKSTRMQARRRCAEYINAREAANDRPPLVDAGTPISRPDDGARAAAGWSLDATSGKAMPASATEAAALLAAAGISATTLGLWLLGGPASGNLTDSSGANKTLTAGGSNGANVSYQQSVTGWAAKAIVCTGGAAGIFENTTFPNVNASTPTLILYSELTASGGTFTIMRYGDGFDDDCTMEQNNSSNHIQGGEGDGTRTAGANDPVGQVRPFALSCGAAVILASDQETIAVGTKAANGTTVTIGGDNNNTNFPNNGKHLLMWLIDAALSSAQIKTLFTTAGWTVPW